MQTEGFQQNPLLTAAAKEKRKSIFQAKILTENDHLSLKPRGQSRCFPARWDAAVIKEMHIHSEKIQTTIPLMVYHLFFF